MIETNEIKQLSLLLKDTFPNKKIGTNRETVEFSNDILILNFNIKEMKVQCFLKPKKKLKEIEKEFIKNNGFSVQSTYNSVQIVKNFSLDTPKFKKDVFQILEINKFLQQKFQSNFKINQIDLKNSNQFQKLKIDLTYPKGHKFAGKPMQKVCFIGQNGTGKTSILKVIKSFISNQDTHLFSEETDIKIDFENNNESFTKSFNKDFKNETNYQLNNTTLIHFPADIFDKPKSEYIDVKGVIDFEFVEAKTTWELLKKEIIEFNKQEKIQREEISKIVFSASASKIKESALMFEEWKGENQSPLEKFAKIINPFLNKFNLKIKTLIDYSKKDDINFVKIENLQGEEFGNLDEVLSTGTKQVLYTIMPLYSIKPENAIILFDEPERSLYPDIQKEIIDFYVNQYPTSQFFFATHSPIIASNFEPWEIVELKFNKKTGKVYQEKWYKGERHVDHYFKDPRYLSWDDILMEIYGLKNDGNVKRIDALMKVATLKSKLEKKKITEIEKKEYKRLANLVKYNF